MNGDASYWLEKAWVGGEWARNVRVDVRSDGFITSVAVNQPQDNAELIAGVVLPGVPNLHSHAFQRAAAGLTEKRVSTKRGEDNFWTWRNIMHSFVTRLTPEDNKAIAAQLYVEMLKAGYTAVGEFHYLHRDPGGQPYADLCEMGNGIIEASELAGIGLTLPSLAYFPIRGPRISAPIKAAHPPTE